MLVECGFVRARAADGQEWTFTPSFARIATLGQPREIVSLYGALHGPHASQAATYVLACLCDQDDPASLIGWLDEDRKHVDAGMPLAEQVIIAQHLMRHGIVGTARPSKGGGKFSPEFNASEYVAAARVHLGLSSADAEALSMTEFQMMFEMKFPGQGDSKRDVPSREEYYAQMNAIKEKRGG